MIELLRKSKVAAGYLYQPGPAKKSRKEGHPGILLAGRGSVRAWVCVGLRKNLLAGSLFC